jgi:hypothetical protein
MTPQGPESGEDWQAPDSQDPQEPIETEAQAPSAGAGPGAAVIAILIGAALLVLAGAAALLVVKMKRANQSRR